MLGSGAAARSRGLVMTVSTVRRWRSALRHDCCFPSGTCALSALRRLVLISICLNEVMGVYPLGLRRNGGSIGAEGRGLIDARSPDCRPNLVRLRPQRRGG